jgi:uncharacterized 2Fe-2S/4Fe-4S cluster protein (DUF4445 family)
LPTVKIIYGEQSSTLEAETGSLLGDVIARSGLPFEQPCAGRGTCGKCKVLNEGGLGPPDEIEHQHLSDGELAVGSRLACRARLVEDAQVVLAPVVVYSDKMFKASTRYKRERSVPLGLAIDLGSTTAAAFLTMLDNGEVCAGAASLNQQAVYGADVISRMGAAQKDPQDAERLHRLAVSSIGQAVDALNLSASVRQRIQRAVVVCNPAMHHLLARLPVNTLALMPFEPATTEPIQDARDILEGIFPDSVQVRIPPLIGGFVGADALACLAYFEFDRATAPILAVDLGTNGEVMLTDGRRILTASTAAGPAFEGVNISCGSRAVDGAITRVRAGVDSSLEYETIGGLPPIGLTGSGLMSAIATLRRLEAIEPNGRMRLDSPLVGVRPNGGGGAIRFIAISPDQRLSLNQWDVRELQKAKGAIRAAIEILMGRLQLKPSDLKRIIMTGSFGGQVDVEAALALGMLPPVRSEVVESIPNGAGYGAASFLTDEGFQRAVRIAHQAEQIDLDSRADFIHRFTESLALEP